MRPRHARVLSGRSDIMTHHSKRKNSERDEITKRIKKMCEESKHDKHDHESRNKIEAIKENDKKDNETEKKEKRRKSRWHSEMDRVIIPGLPVALTSIDLTPEQQQLYILQLQIEEISLKLRTGNLGISLKPEERSPSPEPVYNSQGVRLNTREIRVRQKLEEERHNLVKIMMEKNPDYKPPPDYKIPANKLTDKIFIPQERYPNINFIGLLIGPRGNTLKRLETETGCKIIIRGKGSLKEGKLRLAPMPGEDEPLHALITAPTETDLARGISTVKRIIREGIDCPDGDNELRKMQLRELAELNGTLIASELTRCRNCGASDHRHWECTEARNVTNMIICSKCGGAGHLSSDCIYTGEKVVTAEEKAKLDDEYQSLMKELGVTHMEDDGPMLLGLPKALVTDLPWANNYSGNLGGGGTSGGLTDNSRPAAGPLPIAATAYNSTTDAGSIPMCPGLAPLPSATVRTLVSHDKEQNPQSASHPWAFPPYGYAYPASIIPPVIPPNYYYPVPPPVPVSGQNPNTAAPPTIPPPPPEPCK